MSEKLEQPHMLISNDSITIITEDGPRTTRRGQTNFISLQESIKNKDWDRVLRLSTPLKDLVKTIAETESGAIRVVGNQILYEDEPLNGYLVTKIISFIGSGLPFEHLLAFLENLQYNPSMRAREELYRFLETEDLPITTDGCFIAYKAVNSEWKDKHSNTIDNSVGSIVTMNRSEVDDNQSIGCSRGLHAGSLKYVKGFGSRNDNYLLVKINPMDVVCIPSSDSRKLRCCKYTVTGVMKGEMVHHAYDADGVTPVGNKKFDSCELDSIDDDDWEVETSDYDYELDWED